MKNFVKILFLMLMTLFIVSCSSDPEVDAVAEALASGSDGKVSESDAKCVAKAMKKELSDEEWTAYHAFIVEDGESPGMEMFGKQAGAMLSCGVEMDMDLG